MTVVADVFAGVEPSVSLRGVTRLFGAHPAVAGIDLDLPPGAVVLLHGPNGAGKSTLLRLCATAIAPTFGRGSVLGFDLRRREEIRRRVELLGHRTRLYEDLTPREHLRLVARLHGIDGELELPLAAFGLTGVADRQIRALSQGTRQRIAAARALLRRPRLLLLDEPYGSLDEAARCAIDELILRIRDDGATVVVATHDVGRALSLADHTLAMEGGRVDALRPVAAAEPVRGEEAMLR